MDKTPKPTINLQQMLGPLVAQALKDRGPQPEKEPIYQPVKAALAKAPPARNASKKSTRITLSFSFMTSPAFKAQIDRYCAANLHTTNKGEQIPLSYSRLIRRAVYAMLQNPQMVRVKPRILPVAYLKPSRTKLLGWTMPNREDYDYFQNFCKDMELSNSVLVRRALYVYTKDCISTDKAEAIAVAADAWD